MDPYQLIATILWSGFAVALIALLAGLLLAQAGHRNSALAFLFAAVAGTLTFSFIAGFSIGGFTAVIPVLVCGYVIGMGRGSKAVGTCVLGAAVVYLLLSWLVQPFVPSGSVLAIAFGFLAIPLYGVAAVAAFGWALLNPPRKDRSPSV